MRTFFLCWLLATCATSFAQTPVKLIPPQPTTPKAATRSQREDELKATRLLRSSMSRQPVANVRFIISQRLYYNSTVFQQIKVEMSTDGKVHDIVMAPLSYAGTEGVDDGVTLRTYSPDSQEVIEQPSARQQADDVPFRMNLVRSNYNVRVDRKEKIAGRDAIVVEAMPKNEELETRCYTIDEKTGVLLRLETCKEGRAPMLHFEAKMVQFPSDFPDGTFRLDASFAKVEHYNRKCVSPQSAGKLRADLGFEPVIPGSLPYGFVPQELQASTDSRSPALIVRITDGLAKVTVLEWKKIGRSGGPTPPGTVVDNSKSLTILVSGDIPDEEKWKILNSFLGAVRAEKFSVDSLTVESWAQELKYCLNLFPSGGGVSAKSPTILDIPIEFRFTPN